MGRGSRSQAAVHQATARSHLHVLPWRPSMFHLHPTLSLMPWPAILLAIVSHYPEPLPLRVPPPEMTSLHLSLSHFNVSSLSELPHPLEFGQHPPAEVKGPERDQFFSGEWHTVGCQWRCRLHLELPPSGPRVLRECLEVSALG